MSDHIRAAMLSEGDFLEHYGKKGMKWGVRKRKTASPTHTSADAARVNKISARVKKNGLDNLSNDDLAKLNKRSQLVSEYKKNNPSMVQRGNKATKDALAVIGTATAAVAVGVKLAKSPVARKGAKIVADVLKNMATSGGPANGGTYTQVFRAITS